MNSKTFIYLIKNATLIAQKEVKTIDHHHHAIEIIIKTEPGSKIILNEKIIKENTIILNADKAHSLDSCSNWVIIFLINPDSELGSHVRNKYLMNNDEFNFNFDFNPHLEMHFAEMTSTPLCKDVILHIYQEIIGTVCGTPSRSFRLDDRIRRIFNEINQLEEKKIPTKELASLAFLSESRFMHLFKEEVKIPVRQYLSWIRLLDAVKMILGGESFTKAAIYSGFTDLPHLHKTFTHFFGVKISNYLNNSRFIQVLDYSDE